MDNSDIKRDRINTLIEKENREQERTILMILRDFSDSAASSARMWKAIEDEHKHRLDKHEEIILRHENTLEEHNDVVLRGRVTWYWLTFIVGSLSTTFVGAFIYGYSLIAEIRDTVRTQQAIQEFTNSSKK
jgi:hypothetical protein